MSKFGGRGGGGVLPYYQGGDRENEVKTTLAETARARCNAMRVPEQHDEDLNSQEKRTV